MLSISVRSPHVAVVFHNRAGNAIFFSSEMTDLGDLVSTFFVFENDRFHFINGVERDHVLYDV
jgi:hypothetical protein